MIARRARAGNLPQPPRVAYPFRFFGERLLGPAALLGSLIVPLIAMLLTGDWRSYLDLPSIVLVIVGTVAATLLGTGPADLVQLPQALRWSIRPWPVDPVTVARRSLDTAATARKAGFHALDDQIERLPPEAPLRRALEQVRDGAPPDRIASLMQHDRWTLAQERGGAIAVLRRAAETAPAMGLIGTLVGLVQMLGQLDDPRAIGPALAVALLTTLYGALLAHAALLPLAERMDARLAAELHAAEIEAAAVESIARRENPRILETTLEALLPTGPRLRHFER